MLRPPALTLFAWTSLALLPACSGDVRPQTAEETIAYALTKLAGENDPGVVWDLLPPSYQNEVHGWCRRIATELPGKTYDKLFQTMHEVGITMKSQGDKLLNFAPLLYIVRGADEEDMLAMIHAIANIPILLGDSEIASLGRLKTADIGLFLRHTGGRIWQQGARAYRVTGESVGTTFNSFTYKTIRSDGDSAELEFEFQGIKKPMAFKKVEGCWLPTDLVENWAMVKTRVEGFLNTLASADTRTFLAGIDAQLDEVLADIKALKKIKSRGKFSNQLVKLGAKYGKSLFGALPFPK